MARPDDPGYSSWLAQATTRRTKCPPTTAAANALRPADQAIVETHTSPAGSDGFGHN